MLVMFSFFFSPRVLRVPSTDRPETLPHGRNLRAFYNASPKLGGRSPKKIWGPKTCKISRTGTNEGSTVSSLICDRWC